MARIALVAGICTRHDAISNAVRMQEQLLIDAGHEVVVFSQHTDFPGPTHRATPQAWSLQADEWFRSADLVVFHFGIHYLLFDELLLSHPNAARVVHFHNVTPPEFLGGESRIQAIRGIDQFSIAIRADAFWSDSSHNTDCLAEWSDIDPATVLLLPLAVHWETLTCDQDRPATYEGPKRVIAVGRLTEAKGQRDLVDAVALLPETLRNRVVVDIIGAEDHSDPTYIESLREQIRDLGLEDIVHIELDLDDAALRDRYAAADVFVLASRHEGFCVPVIEALAARCRVIATDVGAVRETLGTCGALLPVGDVPALAAAIEQELGAGPLSEEESEVRLRHLDQFSVESLRVRLLAAVDAALFAGPGDRPEVLPATSAP